MLSQKQIYTIEKLKFNMIKYYSGDPKRIQHFIKVHSFARLIAINEDVPDEILFVIECAALVHDIGIKPAEQKFSSSSGKLQEQEGVAPCRDLLTSLNFDEAVIDRICFLVSHHHTYNNIDTIDYQILVEADFLVNLYEDNASKQAVDTACDNIFKTLSGKCILKTMYKN